MRAKQARPPELATKARKSGHVLLASQPPAKVAAVAIAREEDVVFLAPGVRVVGRALDAPDEEVLHQKQDEDQRDGNQDRTQMLGTRAERGPTNHEEYAWVREDQILSEETADRGQAEQPGEVAHEASFEVTKCEEQEREVQRKADRVGLELLREIDRTGMERDHEHEQQARGRALEQPPREPRRHQHGHDPGKPRHRAQDRLRQREDLRQEPTQEHEPDRANREFEQRLLDQVHCPGALVEPQRGRRPKVAPSAQEKAVEHDERRQHRQHALAKRGAFWTDEPRQALLHRLPEGAAGEHGNETYGPGPQSKARMLATLAGPTACNATRSAGRSGAR